jgi:hypothetical protein
MKKVAVIGASGNMGLRYSMILKEYCYVDVIEVDMHNHITCDLSECDGFIIATPTDNHLIDICVYKQWKKPILCEKPIVKTKQDYDCLIQVITSDVDLSMINQYEFLNKGNKGHTEYNYFKTGKDGLMWDCINVIGTAKSSYDVKKSSLVWECVLNGDRVDFANIDKAYIANIKAWVNGWRNKEYIIMAHEKVLGAINAGKN